MRDQKQGNEMPFLAGVLGGIGKTGSIPIASDTQTYEFDLISLANILSPKK